MSLLSQEKRDVAHKVTAMRKAARVEAARAAYWGIRNGKTTQLPLGLKRLNKPEERELWMRHVSRGAIQEQEGMVQSDINSTMINHPDVQRAFSEEDLNART